MSRMRRIGLVLVIVAALAAGTIAVRALYDVTGQASRAAAELDPAAPASTARTAISTDLIVGNLQGYLATHPADSAAFSNLGIAYLQKARETGDPSYYTLADGALRRALALDPKNYRTLSGLGALALSRHQFRTALELGQQAQALNPYNAGVYGIQGDAQIEMGHYPEAFALFEHMTGLRPDLSSYARISYARELSGDLTGAAEAMQAAAEAEAPNSEAANWARVQLGNLYFGQGQFEQAAQTYQSALNFIPNYPFALAGLANVRAATGSYSEAITLYNQAINTMPLPQFIIALGDIDTAAGRTQDAAREYQLVEVEARLFEANGVEMDAEIALFDADHARNLPQALERAKTAYAQRSSITVADILAWTLYQSGDYTGARDMENQALRLGSRNALMFYHAGVIAHQLHDDASAIDYLGKALALNPKFSLLYAEPAARLLAELQAGPAGQSQSISSNR